MLLSSLSITRDLLRAAIIDVDFTWEAFWVSLIFITFILSFLVIKKVNL